MRFSFISLSFCFFAEEMNRQFPPHQQFGLPPQDTLGNNSPLPTGPPAPQNAFQNVNLGPQKAPPPQQPPSSYIPTSNPQTFSPPGPRSVPSPLEQNQKPLDQFNAPPMPKPAVQNGAPQFQNGPGFGPVPPQQGI